MTVLSGRFNLFPSDSFFLCGGGEDFPPTPLCLCHYTQICRAATYTFSFHHPNLKLIHDLANALATGANDASMDPAVQGDVLRDHLFQLIHDGLNGISCSYGFVLIPCNSNLILWRHSRINLKKNKNKNTLIPSIWPDIEHHYQEAHFDLIP